MIFQNNIHNRKKKIEITQINDIWDGILNSQLYWYFYLNWSLFLIKDNTVNSNCNTISYSYSWTLKSDYWWELEITDNYFCPLTNKSKLTIFSEIIWEVVLNDDMENVVVTTTDSRWNTTTVSWSLIFDNKKISIDWLVNSSDLSATDSEIWNSNVWVNINTKIEWSMMNLNMNLDRKLSEYTIWKTSKNDTNILSFGELWSLNKIHYYNFEWEEQNHASNNENKWKILTVWDWWSWNDSYDKISVKGQKLLYVKWWNIYINTDIYNNSNNSQLVIVVKRDKTNRQNWWNIYIDSNVTNIDAIIILDWSIMSFDWSNSINTIDDNNPAWLWKQLLIYWSIATKNTFWENKAIYWTDEYISWWWQETGSNKYNLANLRNFRTTLNDWIEWNCESVDSDIISVNTNNDVQKYAFAWKKECFLSEDPQNWLRSTNKLTSVVIEYNPVIQTDPHFILQK